MRRMEQTLMVTIVLVVLILAVFMGWAFSTPADAREGCNSRSCHERVAMKQCSQTRVVACIRRAALHHRVSLPMLMRKARCESTLNPLAVNGVHAGLFQFRIAAPSTWATTRYASRSPWSAKWSSLAAAWMHARGRGGEWACR